MNRRAFLGRTMPALLASAYLAGRPQRLLADTCSITDMPRTLVNVMLQGGADLRYLFMPSPGHDDAGYVSMIWAARKALYDGAYETYRQMFDAEYLLTTDPRSGMEFGIHRSSAWLKAQMDDGKAAVVCNAYCSRNRRHDQSVLNADAGIPDLEILNFDRSGWGGRLVEYMGDDLNSVELGNIVSTFNKGSSPGNRLENVVHAQDMRNMALAAPDDGQPTSRRNILARALRAYYVGRGPEAMLEKPAEWPYHRFFQHSDALRTYGEAIQARIDACEPMPDELANLALSDEAFAQQSRNLFDVCQAHDALNLGVLSMNYGGWDSHDNQASEITGNLQDVFGAVGGLATALSAIEGLPYDTLPAANQLLFYFASDFGRQLVANGAAGTDHGSGTYSLLIGSGVYGGVYGEMFPHSETQPDLDGLVPLQTPGADIEGRTSTERITARAVDWIRPGAGDAVFPGASSSSIEDGVDFDDLLVS